MPCANKASMASISICIDAGGLRIWSQYIADTQLVSTFATNSQAEGGKRHPGSILAIVSMRIRTARRHESVVQTL